MGVGLVLLGLLGLVGALAVLSRGHARGAWMLRRTTAVGVAVAGVVVVGIAGVISGQHQPVTTARSLSSSEPRASAPVVSASAPALNPGGKLSAADAGVWDSLAHCESGGNWASNTGNGLYGGVQLDQRAWLRNGGAVFGALPNDATREQQIIVAERVRRDHGGFSAWTSCARKLGIRR